MKNLKALKEQRAALHATLNTLIDKADQEQRAMSEEERADFEKIEAEIKDIDATIECEKRARGIVENPIEKTEQVSKEQAEERAFVDYVMGRASEMRATGDKLEYANNGAIIPTTIANRIIKEVKDRCPILQRATIYNVKGTLKIPVWGANESDKIAVGYGDDFTELTANTANFTSVDLGGFLAGALVLIGRRLENNGAFDVVTFIVNQMAEEIAGWMEGELLNGSGSDAAQGLLKTTNVLTAAGSAVTADDLVGVQAKVKQVYQAGAVWTMHPDMFLAVKKLKYENKHFLLQDDMTGELPYRLLGKPVYLSDNMPADQILYGDYSALSVNIRENISIEVLREKYATQHALGVVAWMEFDARVTDNQKVAVLKLA